MSPRFFWFLPTISRRASRRALEPSPRVIRPATSITLAPGYSITIDDTGATVSYNGAQFHAALRLEGPGFIHLPIRYTPIDVSRPAATRRHFIQFFVWAPARPFDPSEWILR